MIKLVDETRTVSAAWNAVEEICKNYDGLQPGCLEAACVESLAIRAAHDPGLQQQLVIRALMIQAAQEEQAKRRVIKERNEESTRVAELKRELRTKRAVKGGGRK